MNYKSIFGAVGVVAITVVLLAGLGASAQTKSVPPKVDPRLVGYWWNEKENGGGCRTWEFKSDGTGSMGMYCDGGLHFNFTITNSQIKFHNAWRWSDDENGGKEKVDDAKFDFSFSDDRKTLILDKERLIKVDMYMCC